MHRNRMAATVNKKKQSNSSMSSGQEITVQETNNSSIGSKFSMASLGYFEDPFLQYFVKKKIRRSPLINRGYYVRAKAIDYAIKTFLSAHPSEKVQIISLGAGFDTSYFRMREQGLLRNTKFVEIDLSDVVKRKIAAIQENRTLSDLVGSITIHQDGISTDSYMLVSCNLTNIEKIEQILGSSFKYDAPTLLISEVVITYIEKEGCSRLIEWTKKRFLNSIFLLYEQIHPKDGFGLVMLRHFRKLQSPLRCIEYYPDLASQIQRFQNLGWNSVNAIDMNYFYYELISKEERDRIDNIEKFDEYEEWHLKCSHYSTIAAFSGSCCSLKSKLFAEKEQVRPEIDCHAQLTWKIQNKDISDFERYGHRLVQISNGLFFVSGGFGISGSKHQRLSDGFFVEINSGQPRELQLSRTNIFGEPKMYHSTTSLQNDLVFVFGGRASPLKPSSKYSILQYHNGAIKPEGNEKPWQPRFESVWNGDLLNAGSPNCDYSQPPGRWRHSATSVVFEDDTEHVVIFGGRSHMNLALSDCWTFDVKNKVWSEHKFSSSVEIKKRHSHSASNWKNDIVLIGGVDENSRPLNLVQILKFNTKPVSLENVELAVPLPARYSHTAHVLRDQVWIVGGVDLKMCSDLLLLDLEKLSWYSFNLKSEDPSNPIMLCNHASILTDDEELLVIGGGGNCFSFGTHFNTGLLCIEIPSLS